MSNYVCKGCWPDAEEIGELAPGYGIVVDQKYFHIVSGDHPADILLTFENTPSVDPNPNDKDRSPEAKEAKKLWLALVERELREKFQDFPLERAFELLTALQKVGWDRRNERYTTFLFNRAATIIRDRANDLVGLSEDDIKKKEPI